MIHSVALSVAAASGFSTTTRRGKIMRPPPIPRIVRIRTVLVCCFVPFLCNTNTPSRHHASSSPTASTSAAAFVFLRIGQKRTVPSAPTSPSAKFARAEATSAASSPTPPSAPMSSSFSTSESPTAATATGSRTRYTIDDAVCAPTRPHVLQRAVEKACRSVDIFLDRKPISGHTREAFDVLMAALSRRDGWGGGGDGTSPTQSMPTILDSGCGTGRSTKLLARMHPDHLVIGVDRSFVRLTKVQANRRSGADDDEDDDDDDEGSDEKRSSNDGNGDDGNDDVLNSSASSKRPYCLQVGPNAYLVRAELVDFWRCCLQNEWWQNVTVTHHYLLYPNPYPTNARLTQRWYAHPSFPLLLRLGAETVILRSNWENYLSEFAASVQLAHVFYSSEAQPTGDENEDDSLGGGSGRMNPAAPYVASAKMGPQPRTDRTLAYTNFEAKYDNVGEPTYELILSREGNSDC